MKKYRVFSLANEIGISTTELIKYLKELGIEVKGNLSTIDEENANIVNIQSMINTMREIDKLSKDSHNNL